MTKLRAVVLLAVVALLLFPALVFAQAPQLPCRFYGTVQVDGQDVADGTVITATIEGDSHTAVTGTTVYGPSTYALKIVPPEDARYTEGAQITFTITTDEGTFEVEDKGTFDPGTNTPFPLSVGEAPIPVEGISDVEVYWSEGNSTVVGSTLILYLGEQPEGPQGPQGAAGAQGPEGEAGEDAPGGVALPVVALVIAIIAVGVAMMSMRRRV